mmetsp:Transcript_28426/g.51370  ORF Transcript_28426/g.51370 Transcript_28426/m.51370 type:complete len:94 (+) Transcript_28426:299-580(+)
MTSNTLLRYLGSRLVYTGIIVFCKTVIMSNNAKWVAFSYRTATMMSCNGNSSGHLAGRHKVLRKTTINLQENYYVPGSSTLLLLLRHIGPPVE